MKRIKTVTTTQLRRILARVKGAQPLGFTAVTKCKARVNPLGDIYKAQRVSAFVGARYEAAMNRVLAKAGEEPSFVAGARQWGSRVEGAPALVRKGDNWYMGVHVLRRSRPVYLVNKGRDLTVVTPDVVADHLPVEKPRLIEGLAAIERRDYALDSLVFVHVMGHRYRIRPDRE